MSSPHVYQRGEDHFTKIKQGQCDEKKVDGALGGWTQAAATQCDCEVEAGKY